MRGGEGEWLPFGSVKKYIITYFLPWYMAAIKGFIKVSKKAKIP